MNVKFYDKEGNQKFYDIKKPIGSGRHGTIYKLDDNTCLKYFYKDFDLKNSNVIDMIMNLHLDSFYEIYNLLYDTKNDFCGYVMKYYKQEDIDIMFMPTEYTIDNFRKISKSLKELAKNNLSVIDLHNENVILDSNNITVIDTDLYMYVPHYTKETLYKLNINQLYFMFRGLYIEDLAAHHITMNNDRKHINELFCNNNDLDTVCKKLSKYKYPIEYLYERRNR